MFPSYVQNNGESKIREISKTRQPSAGQSWPIPLPGKHMVPHILPGMSTEPGLSHSWMWPTNNSSSSSKNNKVTEHNGGGSKEKKTSQDWNLSLFFHLSSSSSPSFLVPLLQSSSLPLSVLLISFLFLFHVRTQQCCHIFGQPSPLNPQPTSFAPTQDSGLSEETVSSCSLPALFDFNIS